MEDPKIEYSLSDPQELWWCDTHKRPATHIKTKTHSVDCVETNHVCDPDLGGITIGCRTVNLTGFCELVKK